MASPQASGASRRRRGELVRQHTRSIAERKTIIARLALRLDRSLAGQR